MSDSLRLDGLLPTRLPCPWNSPGKNSGVGSHSLNQEIFLTQGSNPDLLHCRWILYSLSHQRSPLDCKETKPVNPKGNQPGIFIGRTDAEAEAPILWPPDVKSWLIRKDPHVGKDWRQEEKRAITDDLVGWHHQLNGHEFEQAPGDDEGQGSLACCSPWGSKKPGLTEWLNNSVSASLSFAKLVH